MIYQVQYLFDNIFITVTAKMTKQDPDPAGSVISWPLGSEYLPTDPETDCSQYVNNFSLYGTPVQYLQYVLNVAQLDCLKLLGQHAGLQNISSFLNFRRSGFCGLLTNLLSSFMAVYEYDGHGTLRYSGTDYCDLTSQKRGSEQLPHYQQEQSLGDNSVSVYLQVKTTLYPAKSDKNQLGQGQRRLPSENFSGAYGLSKAGP